jgi:hypothetical protein
VVTGLVLAELEDPELALLPELVLLGLVPADELAPPEFAPVGDVVARVVVVVVAVVFALACASTGS